MYYKFEYHKYDQIFYYLEFAIEDFQYNRSQLYYYFLKKLNFSLKKHSYHLNFL